MSSVTAFVEFTEPFVGAATAGKQGFGAHVGIGEDHSVVGKQRDSGDPTRL